MVDGAVRVNCCTRPWDIHSRALCRPSSRHPYTIVAWSQSYVRLRTLPDLGVSRRRLLLYIAVAMYKCKRDAGAVARR